MMPVGRYLRLAFLILFLFCTWQQITLRPAAEQEEESAIRSPKGLLLSSRHLLAADEDENGGGGGVGEGVARWWRRRRRAEESPCGGAPEHTGFPDSCSYARAHEACDSGGVIEYIHIFYCWYEAAGGASTWMGYVAMAVWLAALFYMLGNTAADYFCSCLERLSELLELPPTVAGVTLLPLGNGAPDVFASIVSFMGGGAGGAGGEVGLSSVLGGAVFVVTVVAGLVNILVAGGGSGCAAAEIHLDRRCFIRDGLFFLFSMCALFGVLWTGSISVWGALGYLSIYVIYAVVVAASELLKGWQPGWIHRLGRLRQEEAAAAADPSLEGGSVKDEECGAYTQLLPRANGDDSSSLERVITLPQWMWAAQVAIYSQQHSQHETEQEKKIETVEEGGDEATAAEAEEAEEKVVEGSKQVGTLERAKSVLKLGRKASQVLIEWPLTLPRMLTIPVVEEGRWSRPRAVTAAVLAPVLLVAVWSSENGTPIRDDLGVLAAGGVFGALLGVAAYFTTAPERPPQGNSATLLWIAAGFFMSMVWFYVIARELVAALVSLAAILGVDAALMGLTVLAWGNSMGDLVANTAICSRGGADGVQIAVSGCYASPMFNALVGLGVSLLIASARVHPAPYHIRGNNMAMFTVAFLVAGIVAAMVAMPCRGMKPSRALGVGLILLYGVFLVLRGCQTLGLVSLV